MSENLSGVLLLYKPSGITSHDVVGRIRKIFHTRQVGHTGTLDPMATGVLPILVGSAVKASEYLTADSKTYKAGMRLGIETDTEDISGMTIRTCDDIPNDEVIEKAVLSFLGEYRQIPPMYSAVKIGGEKLYEKARRGEVIEREARLVRVEKIECRKHAFTEWEIVTTVSKGTYIRTLISDIGKKLGCGAAMSSLERTASGDFTLDMCHTIDDLEKASDLSAFLLPVSKLFSSLLEIKLPEFYERLAKNGAEIYFGRAKITPLPEGERVRMIDGNGSFFALGEVRKFDTGLAIKPIKFFK